jgi:hypothetical protein
MTQSSAAALGSWSTSLEESGTGRGVSRGSDDLGLRAVKPTVHRESPLTPV